MHNDEFDHYFKRAALELEQQNNLDDSRRGSLPNNSLLIAEPGGVKRASSCRHPRRPRISSKSPSRRASATSVKAANGDYGGSTLKAPTQDTRPHSAPHSRSSSWKKSRRPRSARPDDLNDESRSRSGSISIEDTLAKLEQLKLLQSEDVYPVRSFTTSAKGLVNRGDSFKRKTNKQVTTGDAVVTVPVHSRGTPESDTDVVVCVDDVPPSPTSNKPARTHKVYVLGTHGVGKTSLLQQFMTSDYMGATETYDDDANEVTVTVSLDGETTSIDFIELTTDQVSPLASDIDAYVLVFGLNDQESFYNILSWLENFRKTQINSNVAIVIVANKSDLVRNKQVKENDAREACRKHSCKYASVSAVMNHKVDDLLVGIAKQIQLNPERHLKKESPDKESTKHINKGPKGLFGKLFNRKQPTLYKSCDNLLVL